MTTVASIYKHNDWIRGLVEQANRVQIALDGLDDREAFTRIKTIVDHADIVVGVFQDHGEPLGVGMVLIKGANLCRGVIAASKTARAITAAIPCVGRDQAIAASRLWEDTAH